jgi:hypothetical protein
MSTSSYSLAIRHARHTLVLSISLAVLATFMFATRSALADPWWREQQSLPSTSASQPAVDTLVPFDATGLPAGAARGIPQRATLRLAST